MIDVTVRLSLGLFHGISTSGLYTHAPSDLTYDVMPMMPARFVMQSVAELLASFIVVVMGLLAELLVVGCVFFRWHPVL